MKVRLIIILIANMFMLHFIIPIFKLLSNMLMLHVIIPILKIAKLNNLVDIIVKQLQTNISYVEQQLKGSVK